MSQTDHDATSALTEPSRSASGASRQLQVLIVGAGATQRSAGKNTAPGPSQWFRRTGALPTYRLPTGSPPGPYDRGRPRCLRDPVADRARASAPELPRLASRVVVLQHAIGCEHLLDKCQRAASRNTDGDGFAMELVQLRKRRWIPVENPQRLIIKTGKHHDTLGCGRGRDAGLYECHVDAGVAIEQQSKIVNRPAANALLNDCSIASQYFDVSSCVLVVGARFRAARSARMSCLSTRSADPLRALIAALTCT